MMSSTAGRALGVLVARWFGLPFFFFFLLPPRFFGGIAAERRCADDVFCRLWCRTSSNRFQISQAERKKVV
jgi:hypothetical protein